MKRSVFSPASAVGDPAGLLGGRGLLAFLGVYFCAQVLVRLAISTTLALDEAEQVLLSQWFQWGYSGQPPLYAWLQHLVFEILGTNLLALAVVKNGLLFLSYLFFWLTARTLWPHRDDLTSLAVLSWFLIPQIVWEAQRDLSHSVMVLATASASLYWTVRGFTLREEGQPLGLLWFAAFGVLLGLGMLSKYNFVVFAGALTLALLTLPSGRAILLSPRILLTLLLASVVVLPHAIWAASHLDVAVRSLSKVEASVDNNRLQGLGVLLVAGVSFLTPLWIAWAGFFPSLWRRGKGVGRIPSHHLLQRYLAVLAMGLALGVVTLGVSHVKERWVIPLLFLAPLWFFSRATHRPQAEKRVRWFRRVAVLAAVAALLAGGLRSVLGPSLGVTTRVNYPFDDLAQALSDRGVERTTFLTHNAWFAGNLLRRFPESRAYVPGFVLPDPSPGEEIVAVWDAVRSRELPQEMAADLASRFGLDSGGYEAEYLTLPYRFGAGREARVGVLAPW